MSMPNSSAKLKSPQIEEPFGGGNSFPTLELGGFFPENVLDLGVPSHIPQPQPPREDFNTPFFPVREASNPKSRHIQNCHNSRNSTFEPIPRGMEQQHQSTSISNFWPMTFPNDARNNTAERPREEIFKISKRKVKPTEPFILQQQKYIETKLLAIDTEMKDCHIFLERRNKKIMPKENQANIHEQCLWIYHEHFYSNYDRLYFRQEEDVFRRIINELGMNPEQITFKDYKLIHRILPKPKLFSTEFIDNEQERLYDFRASLRSSAKNREKNEELDLSLGREVFALHPICGHIHSGSILAYYRDTSYMVKFTKSELGVQKVLDVNILIKETNYTNKAIVDNIDYDFMALAIELLKYKKQLVYKLREYNQAAIAFKNQGVGLENKFIQEYGWIGSTIKVVSIGLRHIITRFRIRGLSENKNNEKIGKNFGEILITTLSFMANGFANQSNSLEMGASSQVHSIVENQRKKQIELNVKAMMQKEKKTLQSCDWQSSKQKEMESLLENCLGLLVTLKSDVNNFNLDKDSYVSGLAVLTDSQSPEHFNEIYETLQSIMSKLGAK